jgi:hypothetical protein
MKTTFLEYSEWKSPRIEVGNQRTVLDKLDEATMAGVMPTNPG